MGCHSRRGTASYASGRLAPTDTQSVSLTQHDPPEKWMVSTASVLKPVMTHHLNLVGRREECTQERVVTVEQNSATGDPEPQQEWRQRARRQNRLGTVKL